MSNSNLKHSRSGLMVNYFGLFLVLFFFEWIIKFDQKADAILFIGLIVGLLLFMSSFYMVYWKSNWWKYIHQSGQNYDERETKHLQDAVRKAYAAFAVIILSVLLIFSLLSWSVDSVFVVVFLYFAHVLPASILKWKGYEI